MGVLPWYVGWWLVFGGVDPVCVGLGARSVAALEWIRGCQGWVWVSCTGWDVGGVVVVNRKM